ncbi:MAG: radical SAM family heme chaperone HemW [Luminiphilus sp.]|nr:radical SAM family heme chaperone HemW [Luminiphilus sp.]
MIDARGVPLSLYIHLPWCERKCPYCDFNSHTGFSRDLEGSYIQALLADLDSQLRWVANRNVTSVFIGGGTPSLFSSRAINDLLTGVVSRVSLASVAEITLESNPGSAERDQYRGYREAGVNRLSIGVQSFNDTALQSLGRIHTGDDARRALQYADAAGFTRWNIDLMHGLPGQTAADVGTDILEAVRLSAGHISWYQLTVERNTRFWSSPPVLPDEATLSAIQAEGEHRLKEAGFVQYEVSAFSQPQEACQHNINYWRFGDYIGLGAGAHGKLTLDSGQVVRTQRTRLPDDYLAEAQALPMPPPLHKPVAPSELTFEFSMNALRLRDGSPICDFTARTGLPLSALTDAANKAILNGWLRDPRKGTFVTTTLGYQFLDTVVASFL